DRGQNPAQWPEAGMALADVVDEGGPNQITAIGVGGDHMERGGGAMPLVGLGLGGEGLLEMGLGEPAPDGIPLALVQAPGSYDVVETSREVGPAIGHCSA